MSDYSVMSSYSEHLQHRSSTQNLSSTDSEHGSEFEMESGLFIKSFAAAIFIATVVTIGVLFLTLVATLTVMLQSCQSSNAGVLQVHGRSEQDNYCRTFALHADLNSLEVDEFPSICKAHAMQYMEGGQYLRDLNWTISLVNDYFKSLKPEADGLDVVLLDADDILAVNGPERASPLQHRVTHYEQSNQVENDQLQAGVHILQLHSELQASGWSLIFMSRKPEKLRNATIDALISSGYERWSSLIMRSDEELLMESWEYFSRKRTELQNIGFRITSVISSRMDALSGSCLGKHIFKLPRFLNYNSHPHFKSSQLL